MPISNFTILSRAWLEGSSDFQQRVPKPTQSNIAEVAEYLFDPMNRDLFNYFTNFLINRVGFTKVHGRRWENPLAFFKKSKLEYGNTVQEIAMQWVKAHAYRDDVLDLLEIERPKGESAYHSQNRRDRYEISENPNELRSSFDSEYGLNDFLNQILNIPINSDNYDEYRIMIELFSFHEHYKGFFKVGFDAKPEDSEEAAKTFLKSLRAYAGKLKFPSANYTAAVTGNIPVFANPEELFLFYTPEAAAAISVDVLAAIFNVNYADVPFKTVQVDEFPIPGMFALLTTEDFFVCHDTLYENTTFFNPANLTTNHYLHHWGVYSTSPFVPAIAFGVWPDTNIDTIKVNVTGLEISPESPTVEAGWHVLINSKTIGTISPYDPAITLDNIGVTYEVAAEFNNAPFDLGVDTYIDRFGMLHVGREVPAGVTIAITGKSAYINPDGTTPDLKAYATVTVAENPTEVDEL